MYTYTYTYTYLINIDKARRELSTIYEYKLEELEKSWSIKYAGLYDHPSIHLSIHWLIHTFIQKCLYTYKCTYVYTIIHSFGESMCF